MPPYSDETSKFLKILNNITDEVTELDFSIVVMKCNDKYYNGED